MDISIFKVSNLGKILLMHTPEIDLLTFSCFMNRNCKVFIFESDSGGVFPSSVYDFNSYIKIVSLLVSISMQELEEERMLSIIEYLSLKFTASMFSTATFPSKPLFTSSNKSLMLVPFFKVILNPLQGFLLTELGATMNNS